MTQLSDRLPREALVALPAEQLADTLLAAWRDVDAQQHLLDEIGAKIGATGLSIVIHAESGLYDVSAICCGPAAQTNRMAPKLRKVLRAYLRALGLTAEAIRAGKTRSIPAEPGKKAAVGKADAEEANDMEKNAEQIKKEIQMNTTQEQWLTHTDCNVRALVDSPDGGEDSFEEAQPKCLT